MFIKAAKAALLAGAMAVSAVPVLAKDAALIIANTDYKSYPKLDMTNTDLRELRAAYEADGFDVAVVANGSNFEIGTAIDAFYSAADQNDRLAIHYVGRLMPWFDNSHILQAAASSDFQARRAALTGNLELLQNILSVQPGRALLVVATDSERSAAEALRKLPDAKGVLIVGGNYKQLNAAVIEGLEIGTLSGLTRRRGISTNASAFLTDGRFMEAGRARDTSRRDDRANQLADMEAWRSAAEANTHDSLEAYLATYPRGLFRAEASERLKALGPKISPEEQAERDMRLTRTQRRAIQSNLTVLGFDTRGVDGIFGGGTRRALASWQRSERFAESGFLDPLQLRILETSAARKRQDLEREAAERKAADEAAELDFWRATGADGSARGLRDYLTRYPEGIFAAEARGRLSDLESARAPADGGNAAAIENQLGLNDRTRRIIEQRLKALGYRTGPVDGVFDARARSAIATFQEKSGLPPTGYMSNETVGKLISASLFR